MSNVTPPGLNPDIISGLRPGHASKTIKATQTIEQHIHAHDGYVAWSGGKDSTAVLHLAWKVNPNIPVVWFNSGLEYPETQQYIQELVNQWNINFHIIEPTSSVMETLHSSGTWNHEANLTENNIDLHELLIGEPSRVAHIRFGSGELTGLRAGESVGRRILLASGSGSYSRKNGTHVCAPIWRWEARDVTGYLASQGIPVNPVYSKLQRLGAPPHAQRVGLLVDANGAENGRFTWLRVGWPELWEELCITLPRLREWR